MKSDFLVEGAPENTYTRPAESGFAENSPTVEKDSFFEPWHEIVNEPSMQGTMPTSQPVSRFTPNVRSESMMQENRSTSQNIQSIDQLVANAEEIDENTKVLLMKERSLIERLFPTQMEKMLQQIQGKTIKNAMDFRLNLYSMSTQFRLKALKEKYDAAILTIAVEYRYRVSTFMINRYSELNHIVRNEFQKFASGAKASYDDARQYQGYPKLQTPYLALLDKSCNDYMTFVAWHIDRFQQILDEQIKFAEA